MYAVIEDGGKQYRVAEGDRVLLERKDAAPGDRVTFPRVLLVAREGEVHVGKPLLEGASVTGVVERETKGPKVVVMRLRRRKASRTKTGHRQRYTAVRIEKIGFPA